jgi:hypothetical protein
MQDLLSLLPKSGFLYFFMGRYGNESAVYYANVPASELNEEEYEDDSEDKEISNWNFFVESEKSKIYGIYAHWFVNNHDLLY